MIVPHKVVWSEGMLVSPQHLQQADLYHERLLDRRLAALAPQTWGILSLDLDLGALQAEQLRVSRFVGILPEGLYLGFADGDPEAPAARPIGAHFAPAQPVLEVFLAVPKERDGVPSVAAAGTGGSPAAAEDGVQKTRFRAATRPVGDITGESADLPIAFARRNVSVLFGDEARDDFDSIKIAEIVRNASGALSASEAFIPSVLSISASSFLVSSVRRLLALVTAKQRQLSEERRQRDAVTVEFGAADVTRYLQLSALNAAIPILVHAGRDGELGPRELYLFLIQMAGQLSTLVPDADPSAFPAFNFTDLRSTFEELFALLTSLLRQCARGLRGRAHGGAGRDARRRSARRAHRQVFPVRPGGPGARDLRGTIGARSAQPGQDRVFAPIAVPSPIRHPWARPAGHPPPTGAGAGAAPGGLLHH
jgi:type VI secretion system protein ImpJ